MMTGAPERGYYDKRREKYCKSSTSVGIAGRRSQIGITLWCFTPNLYFPAAVAVFQLVWLHRIISLVGAAPQGAGLALGGQFLWQPNVLMRAEIYCHAPSAEKLLMVLKALSKWQLQPEWQTVSKGMRCSGLQSWRSPGSRAVVKLCITMTNDGQRPERRRKPAK